MTRPRSSTLALALAAALSIAACSREPAAGRASSAAAEAVADTAPAAAPVAPVAQKVMPPPAAPEPAITGPGVTADALGSAAIAQPDGARRFIRTAQVEAQVADVQRAATRITDAAARFGGFVTRDDIATTIGRVERRAIGDGRQVELATYVVEGDLQVRVPSDRAQAFLRSIAPELEFLDRCHYEAADAQFDLLRRQLAARRHDAAQAALGDAGAHATRAADRIDAIERREMQGGARDEAIIEQRMFEDRVALATLDLSLRQPERVRRAERPDVDAILRAERAGLGTRLRDAVAAGGRTLVDVAVAGVALWPLWLVGALLLAAVRALRRR